MIKLDLNQIVLCEKNSLKFCPIHKKEKLIGKGKNHYNSEKNTEKNGKTKKECSKCDANQYFQGVYQYVEDNKYFYRLIIYKSNNKENKT